jgi:hypothetical protein
MSDNNFHNKIDVSSELMKMGINIVVPQVAPKVSMKTLSEADFVNDSNAKNPKSQDGINVDSNTDAKNKRIRKKKANLPASLPSSSSMFNSMDSSKYRQTKNEQVDVNIYTNSQQSSQDTHTINLDNYIQASKSQSQQLQQQQQQPRTKQHQSQESNNQDKNSKIKVKFLKVHQLHTHI